ncbi:MAG: hypothetical protein J6U77_07670, partial [Verrucomicrobia bacterium]|nr:hypothetical protein [Verrucomicrobiota bacterium]
WKLGDYREYIRTERIAAERWREWMKEAESHFPENNVNLVQTYVKIAQLEKEVEDFEALRVEFLSNPVAAAYVDSQEQLLNTRKFIGHFISKTIERGVPPSLKEITDIFENNQHCGTC